MNDRIEIHVSLAGDDGWSGKLPEPNTAHTDGPLRTLEAAQAAVRRVKAGLSAQAEIRVWVHGGVYELTQPWLFTAQDSGFPRGGNDPSPLHAGRLAQSWPVVWAAYADEQPVISGGRAMAGGWRTERVNGREAWVTDIPEVATGRWNFRQLWVNGQRRLRPRLPKQGFRQVERALDADYNKFYLNAGSPRFGFKEGELRATWRNLCDMELQFFGWWVAPRVGLAAVDEVARIAWLDRNSMLRLAWGEGEGDGVEYRVENVFEALTDPGEWYLDRPTGRLYYLPLPGEDRATAQVMAPRLEACLRLDGAANLRFEGLTFAHTEWQAPGHFADSTQASWEVPGAVILNRTDNCAFLNCRVLHTNSYGVEINHDASETTLAGCELRDLGAGGVRIWHGCRRNVVRDCEIADGGHVYPAGVGVLIGKSSGNRIEHNHIHDFFYSGVSVGWTWGYGESDSYGNLVEWNHIHDIGKGLLSDMGGIYLLGQAPGTRVRHNHIHDIRCARYGAWCIYTDEGSSDVLIEGNLCHHTNGNAFNQHYGRHNEVRNNIFAYGDDAVISYGKPEPHLGLIFESNIFLSRANPILRGVGTESWTPRQTAFRRNLYWCEQGPVTFHRGGAGQYASQAFSNGFRAEAANFAALGEVPAINAPPRDADWQRARTLTRFVTQTGMAEAPAGAGELRFLREGDTLHIRGEFARPRLHERVSGVLWAREHVEFFLKPFADPRGMVQLGLASDGEFAVVWHDCEPPAEFDAQAKVVETGDGWQAMLRLPLTAIATAVGGTGAPAWTFCAGFSTLPAVGDWTSWQSQGHDSDGLTADPLCVDPALSDFRLRPDSPALKLGFVPLDLTAVGCRESGQGEE
jgi:hypothetical protein